MSLLLGSLQHGGTLALAKPGTIEQKMVFTLNTSCVECFVYHNESSVTCLSDTKAAAENDRKSRSGHFLALLVLESVCLGYPRQPYTEATLSSVYVRNICPC